MSDAIAEPTREAGLRRLDEFASRAGARYTTSRSFDFGPGRRGNVSALSPYIRHRLVVEQELLETVLQRHSPAAASKFVEEVFWRAYFKGWLEQHPDVWVDYRTSLSQELAKLDADSGLLKRYERAVAGNTGIDCFDAWIDELITTGYLHNHARMWFASIWVFTLELPWQLGADLFYRHLIDGDPAANTLSWRWVCGLHTQGKTYLARADNIQKYTDGRFNPDGQLATNAPALTESRAFALKPIPAAQALRPDERFGLLITEEDGCPASLLDDAVPATILGAVATRLRSPLPVGGPARDFAQGAVVDTVDRVTRTLAVSGEVTASDDWGSLLVEWASKNRIETIVTAYAPVGPVAELLALAGDPLERNGIRLVQLRRVYDNVNWPHAGRGYFKLRKQIPALLEQLVPTVSR
ncbi:MAG: DNA photolyase [Chromatiales bacterium]|nr:MAG: DNA photolyase [Chromatiales bacterium]